MVITGLRGVNGSYTFDNPGQYVTQGGTGPFQGLCGGAPQTGGNAPAQPGAPQASPANPGNSPAAAVSSPPATKPASPVPTSTLRTVITVTAPLASTPTQGGVFAPSAKPAPQPSQAPAAPAPAPSSGSHTGSSCSPDGALVCSPDGTQFAICNFGSTMFQPVALGTKCQNGAIAKRDAMYSHRNQRTAI